MHKQGGRLQWLELGQRAHSGLWSVGERRNLRPRKRKRFCRISTKDFHRWRWVRAGQGSAWGLPWGGIWGALLVCVCARVHAFVGYDSGWHVSDFVQVREISSWENVIWKISPWRRGEGQVRALCGKGSLELAFVFLKPVCPHPWLLCPMKDPSGAQRVWACGAAVPT